MNKRIFLCGALMLPLFAFAKGTVTGSIYNKTTGDPIDFVTVEVFNMSTKQPLQISEYTAEDGSFTLSDLADGQYMLRFTNPGNVTLERSVKVAGSDVDMGALKMADDTKVLQEVVVEGIRSQMKFDLDKKVFQVDANIMAAGQSASELLESIPSVEVDQDGEVSLRGNSSVTIWLNGKESGLSADNRAQILEQIPAETIEKIEVITNPSAKYSPEGTAGIINIILKKNRKGGYFGSAEVSADTRGGGNVGFSFNYNDPKWEAYASAGFHMRNHTGTSTVRRQYDDGTFMNSDGENKRHGNNIFVRAGGAYNVTPKDQIYLNAFGMFGHRWGKSMTRYSSDLPGSWISNLNSSHNKGDNRGAHGELGYKHTWNDDHTLDIMAGYNYWGGPGWDSYLQTEHYGEESGIDDVLIYQEQERNINSQNIEAKVDYVQKFNNYLKLEAGFQGNYSHENSPVTTLQGTSPLDMVLNESLYNRFIYDNNISAIYATLGGRAGKFSYSAGVRAEAWQIRAKSLEYGMTEDNAPGFKKNNFALFPSAFLSYALPHDNEIQINYTRRIRRPWGGQLNSFRDISDPTNIQYGNPELGPTYSNSFELNYIKSWTQHILSVSAYLRTSDDNANKVSYIYDDVMYSTWANVGSQFNSGVEIVSKNSLFRFLDLTTTVNLYQRHISSWSIDLPIADKFVNVNNKSQNSFAWDARVMASVKLPWSMGLQATARYNSRQITAQGSREAGWRIDLGLRKSLGDWSFSLSARDLFNLSSWHNVTYGDNFRQESEFKRGGFQLRLTVKYAFGNMKAKRNPNLDAPMDGSGYGETMMQ